MSDHGLTDERVRELADEWEQHNFTDVEHLLRTAINEATAEKDKEIERLRGIERDYEFARLALPDDPPEGYTFGQAVQAVCTRAEQAEAALRRFQEALMRCFPLVLSEGSHPAMDSTNPDLMASVIINAREQAESELAAIRTKANHLWLVLPIKTGDVFDEAIEEIKRQRAKFQLLHQSEKDKIALLQEAEAALEKADALIDTMEDQMAMPDETISKDIAAYRAAREK